MLKILKRFEGGSDQEEDLSQLEAFVGSMSEGENGKGPMDARAMEELLGMMRGEEGDAEEDGEAEEIFQLRNKLHGVDLGGPRFPYCPYPLKQIFIGTFFTEVCSS